MAESIVDTSDADIAVYIDDDQVDFYRDVGINWKARFGHRLKITIGRRIGPAAAADSLVKGFRNYDVYGLSTDDSIYRSKGWDKFVAGCMDNFPNHIGVVSAHHGHGPWVNFPYVSREWIDALGWFVVPGVTHYCWDTALEILGDATDIVYATKDQFEIDHMAEMTSSSPAIAHQDGQQFLLWAITLRREAILKLRAACGRPAEVA
jgi:hypothetical protein